MAAAGTEEFANVSSFKVSIDGMNWTNYESVNGLGIDLEDVPFQGEKNQIMNRPGRFTARDVTLTRRYKKDKELYNWFKDIKAGKQTRKSGSVILLDDEEKEVARFNFFGAWPKAWSGPTLSKGMSGNDTLTEEITLSVADIEMA